MASIDFVDLKSSLIDLEFEVQKYIEKYKVNVKIKMNIIPIIFIILLFSVFEGNAVTGNASVLDRLVTRKGKTLSLSIQYISVTDNKAEGVSHRERLSEKTPFMAMR